MKNFLLGGCSVKANLIILAISTVLGFMLFGLVKVSFTPAPVVEKDTFAETCVAHGGCLFVDELPEAVLSNILTN